MRTSNIVSQFADKLWLVGDASSWLTSPIELTKDDDGIFSYSGTFGASSYLKFHNSVDAPTAWGGNNFVTPTTNAAASVNCMEPDDPLSFDLDLGPNKTNGSWLILHPGDYDVTVNLNNSTVEFTRTSGGSIVVGDGYDVWIVGASTVWNWNTDANKMTRQNNGVYTWTGNLTKQTSNGLSFNTSDTDAGTPAWNGSSAKWYVAAAAGQTVQNIGYQVFSVVVAVSSL